jgi:glycerol-3-phosphate acyltransferase PlsY
MGSLTFIVQILLAYLLGSVSGSLVLGRLRGIDIRTQGSGNAGGTNALRTQGKGFALAVMAIDVGKGALAAGALPLLSFSTAAPIVGHSWSAVACGAAVILGHVFPLWFRFRGGKGAATLIGVVAVLSPFMLLAMLGVWALVLVLTGFVGLGTILDVWKMPLFALLWNPGLTWLLAFAFAMAAFLTFTHRSNIRRLVAGNENRFRRAMLFNRRHSPEP